MVMLAFGGGVRYNEKANDPGAQTERRGEAGPVSALLGRENSPAAFVSGVRSLLYAEQFRGFGAEAATLLIAFQSNRSPSEGGPSS